ncbi:RBBP9/YdeN family alpha/beta hydrolase [Leifsonia aquatica]|uniref:RBBP9/YdeN family alpha/beta hydrolase n=1 Tax=Leifsonia aquatica TaxID=144185 RepID=UPI0038241B4C
MRAFLILHGWGNFRPAGHWQRELAEALMSRGERVVYPQLPDTDAPTVDAWRAALDEAFSEAATDGARVIVICHSLACMLWLGARPSEASVERVMLVAPPSQSVLAGIPEIASFAELNVVRPSADTRIVASDADPYCPEGATVAYGDPLDLPVTVIPGGGHLELTAGYGEWPSMFAWCLDPSTVLVPR